MDEAFINLSAVKKRVEDELLGVMPINRPGDFNQALMELGATVCIPNGKPKCEECPWNTLCLARQNGRIEEFPYKEAKKKRTVEKKTVLILKEGNKIAIHKRPSKGLLAGLYEFPMLEGHLEESEVIFQLKEMGLFSVRIERLPEAVHIFSHKEWHMIGYAVRVDELEKRMDEEIKDFKFVEIEETQEKYPIPSAFTAYAGYMRLKLGNERFLVD